MKQSMCKNATVIGWREMYRFLRKVYIYPIYLSPNQCSDKKARIAIYASELHERWVEEVFKKFGFKYEAKRCPALFDVYWVFPTILSRTDFNILLKEFYREDCWYINKSTSDIITGKIIKMIRNKKGE